GLFFVAIFLAPVLAASLLAVERSTARHKSFRRLYQVNSIFAAVLLLGLSVVAVLMPGLGAPKLAWPKWAWIICCGCAATHLSALAFCFLSTAKTGHDGEAISQSGHTWNDTVFVVGLVVGSITLFYVGFVVDFAASLTGSTSPSRFIKSVSDSGWITRSAIAGAAIFAIATVVGIAEYRGMQKADAGSLGLVQKGTLIGGMIAVALFYFDFSLSADTMHYMTNVGPALALLDGATPMVNAFSQYGPGPVIATYAAFVIGSPTIGVANIIVQIFNLTFYNVWLACLFRMSRFKASAVFAGFFLIGTLYTGWGLSEQTNNINQFPSVIGFRYLPPLVMVLSISCLPSGARFSFGTFFSSMFATLWSFEACVGTLGIHIGFLAFLALSQHQSLRFFKDAVIALTPVAVAISVMAMGTLIASGELPKIGIYLQFLSTYNLASPFWSLDPDPLFLGWIVPLLAVYLILTEAVGRGVANGSSMTTLPSRALYYQYLPIGMLAVFMATYYLGRSVSYTLVLVLLPAGALAIPAGQWVLERFSVAPTAWKLLTGVFFAVASYVLGASLLSNTSKQSPYSLLLQECRDFARCNPVELLAGLKQRIDAPPVIEVTGNRLSDKFFDKSGMIREAMDLISSQGADQKRITVLLGPLGPRWHVASEVALMLTGRWHTWPRSGTCGRYSRHTRPVGRRGTCGCEAR
ncbi:MAG: hypothetical protein ABL893_11015, partial [Hyphomicrobium sp.]